MHHTRSSTPSAAAGSLALLLAGACLPVTAQDSRENNPFLEEARVALRAALDQSRKLGTELRKAREKNKVLAQALAAANGESEEFRQQYEDIRLQLEAFGIESVKSGEAGIKARLRTAYADLQVANDKNTALSDRLFRLSESIMLYLKQADQADPKARLVLERELRATDEALGIAADTAKEQVRSLDEGRVWTVKQEYNLVVLDVGKASGVTLGMPIRIMRKDRPVGKVLVVDVRPKFAGAIIEELETKGDAIKAGDTIQVLTEK